jgi:hypothetical protein
MRLKSKLCCARLPVREQEGGMVAVDAGVQHRPGDLAAVHAEQPLRRVGLDGGDGAVERRRCPAVERNLVDELGRILQRPELLQQVHHDVHDGGHRYFAQRPRQHGLLGLAEPRRRRHLALAGPQDQGGKGQEAVQRRHQVGVQALLEPHLPVPGQHQDGGRDVVQPFRHGFALLVDERGCLSPRDRLAPLCRGLLKERFELALDPFALPPSRHGDDDRKHLVKVQPRGHDALQRRHVGVRLAAAAADVRVDGDRRLGRRFLPAGRDEQLHRLGGRGGERQPHVAQDGGVLQLAPVVHGPQEDEVDETAWDGNGHSGNPLDVWSGKTVGMETLRAGGVLWIRWTPRPDFTGFGVHRK